MVAERLGSGVVARLHDEVYVRLPHGRLVLLGEPGSGKTGALILLLLAALEHRGKLVADGRIPVPVPVLLTLGKWNPATTTLRAWAEATINRDHPAVLASEYGPDTAGELLRYGHIALFLDGLDELPEGVRAAALKRIDAEARGGTPSITTRRKPARELAAHLDLNGHRTGETMATNLELTGRTSVFFRGR